MNTRTLVDLPKVILRKIILLLHARDYRISRTCKALQKIFKENPLDCSDAG